MVWDLFISILPSEPMLIFVLFIYGNFGKNNDPWISVKRPLRIDSVCRISSINVFPSEWLPSSYNRVCVLTVTQPKQ